MTTICLCWPNVRNFVLHELCLLFLNTNQDWNLGASYRVALGKANEKKPHTMGERFIKPCAMVWWNWFVEENKRRNLRKFLYQTIKVRCRITDMCRDILDQVADEIRNYQPSARGGNRRIELYVLVNLLSMCRCRRVERRVFDVIKSRND